MLYLGQDAFDAMQNAAATPMYTPITKKTFYVVNMTDVKVNGKSIEIEPAVYNRGDAIVDSGSTSVTLPSPALYALRDAFLSLCKKDGVALKGVCSKSGSQVHQSLFQVSRTRAVL